MRPKDDFIEIEGLKLFYKKQGTGKDTIFFLHQSSGSSSIWDRQWEDARFKDFTLICLDTPGHGKSFHSSSPQHDYSLTQTAKSLCQAIQQLGTGNYIVTTISISGNFVGEMATDLTGCQGFFLAGPSLLERDFQLTNVLLPFEYGSVLVDPSPSDTALKNYIKGLTMHHNPRVVDDLISDYRNTDPLYRIALGQTIGQEQWTNEFQNLAKTDKPIRLVFGREEKIINLHYLDRVPLKKWQDKSLIIEDAGHLVNIDQPALFNQLLLEFAEDTLH